MIEDPEHLTWALGVRTRGGGRVRLSTRGKKRKPCPFIKRVNIKRPLRSRLGLAYNLGVLDTVGLPTNRINENPVTRGTRSPLRQDVSRNRLVLCVELVKRNGSNNHQAMT